MNELPIGTNDNTAGSPPPSIEKEKIGKITNYYGDLYAMKRDGKYYWIINDVAINFELDQWEEIDKELYDALIAHNQKIQNNELD